MKWTRSLIYMSRSVLAEDSRHMLIYVSHAFGLLDIVQALVTCSQQWMAGSIVTEEQMVRVKTGINLLDSSSLTLSLIM